MLTVKRYEARGQLRPQSVVQPVAAESGVGAMAQGLQNVGQFMFDVRDEIDTADAMVADTKYSELINDLLYNNETGYMYATGGDAVARREQVTKTLDRERETLLKGLSVGARAHAMRAINKRADDMLASINQHAATQSRDYLNQAAQSSIEMFRNDALFRPDEANLSINRINAQIDDMALRNGQPPEWAAAEKTKAASGIHKDIAMRLSSVSPSGALDYVQSNKGAFLGSDLAEMERILAPAAKAERGRNAGRAASGATGYVYSTQVDYAMGPKRPHKPDQPVVDVIGMAAEQAFGKGARIVITSGQEGDKEQHGSARHKTGSAADFAVYRPDGSRVLSTDPDAKNFALTAARLGARGIGFGSEYMGGDHFHMDLVEANASAGTAPVWASGAKSLSGEIAAAMGEFSGFDGGGINSILEIEDPDIRAAALSEYDLRMSVRKSNLDAALQGAESAAFELVVSGGSVYDLTVEQQSALGIENMTKLGNYQRSINSKENVATDWKTYTDLYDMASSDPNTFASTSLIEFTDRLAPTDFKEMVKLQEKIRSGNSEGGKVPVASMRQFAKPYYVAMGIDDSTKSGAERVAKIEADFIRWYSAMTEADKRAPDEAKVVDYLKKTISTQVTIDPAGWGSDTGSLYDFPFDPKTVDFTEDGKRVTSGGYSMEQMLNPTTDIKLNGVTVPHADRLAMREAFFNRYGWEPTPSEMIGHFVQMGKYQK